MAFIVISLAKGLLLLSHEKKDEERVDPKVETAAGKD